MGRRHWLSVFSVPSVVKFLFYLPQRARRSQRRWVCDFASQPWEVCSCPPLLLHRFFGLLPALKTRRQIDEIGEPQGRQLLTRTGTSHSYGAVHKIRLALVQTRYLLRKLRRVDIHVDRPGNVSLFN